MASTASSMVRTARAISASASMNDCRLLRTMSADREAMRGISTGSSTLPMASILRTRSEMLLAASHTRSRSALILMTLRIERGLVDVALHAVDGHFAAAHQVADGKVAHAVRFNGALDGLFRQAGHHQEIFLQVVEALLESFAGHPN